MEQSLDRLHDLWGERTPYVGEWPVRVDARVLEEPDQWIQSACVLCSNGCALDIGVKNGVIVGVRGRGVDRVNRGRLGPKGLYGWEANASLDRLRQPYIRRNGRLEPASWEEAMTLIVSRTREIRDVLSTQAIGFYTSGQLFLEDYYTLSVIARAGLGTPHLDGNTRLCTATAAEALKQSFGSDGQPGSFTDLDTADTFFHVGHNVAETKTVFWSRILDRRRGSKPPRMVVADPRRTPTAQEADIHLALRSGTNLALLYGLLHLILKAGAIDRDFIDRHTVGFDGLEEAVRPWTPERTSSETGVSPDLLVKAADILGSAERLVSTVLQGVYQAPQATAAAVQVNNLHLIRNQIGKPGCAVFQMNGQPTAQNTRETGCDGGLPGFRNFDNPEHMKDLARIWNVDPEAFAHWGPPTPALEMFQLAEKGSIRMLWISGTNPAVSLPELSRIRKTLRREELFVVVNDAFPTETTALADVVLPAALWGEKTGTFTNSDRTVHLSLKAVEPPGQARSDLAIFLDFAHRMEFRDKDGGPLIGWTDPEGAFDAWKLCSKGTSCDYSGMSYALLRDGSGIQWPCTPEAPRGTERLYTSGVFPTAARNCQTFGHDLVTGASISPERYKAADPAGRAVIRVADVLPPREVPDGEYPFCLTSGRQVYHFHTRTKTGRAPELKHAAPDVFIQMNPEDASSLGVKEGDQVAVESRRGRIEGPAAFGELAVGHLFIPFHYGWWDDPSRNRAVNELFLTQWDPVSKQPIYKQGTARLRRVEVGASSLPGADRVKPAEASKSGEAFPSTHAPLSESLESLVDLEHQLADSLAALRARHPDLADIVNTSLVLERWSRDHLHQLWPLRDRYGDGRLPRTPSEGLLGKGPPDLMQDLFGIWALAQAAKIRLLSLRQASRALRDQEFQKALERMAITNERQTAWLLSTIKVKSPQTLLLETRRNKPE